MTADRAYLRFPSIRGDRIAFVAENDVWLADADGGRAWRLTADGVPVAGARLSPGRRDGRVTPAPATVRPRCTWCRSTGGASTRLTLLGRRRTPRSPAGCRTAGWWRAPRSASRSAAGSGPGRCRWTAAAPERLPYGPCYAVSPGPGGAVVLGTDQRRAGATWQRYRGGTAGKLWIDRDGSGTFERLLGDNPAQLEDPDWVGDRVVFLSDHEGWGNVYSVRPDGTDLRRHSDHGDALRAGAAHRRHPAGLAGARRPLAARRARTRSRGGSTSTWPARGPAGGRARSAPATRSATSRSTAPAGPPRSRCSAPCTG